jgi:hypothetical protein
LMPSQYTLVSLRRDSVLPSSPSHHNQRRFFAGRLCASRALLQSTKVHDGYADWQEVVQESQGPAFRHALGALEWKVVCAHVASFASTLAGKRTCEAPLVAVSEEEALVRILAVVKLDTRCRYAFYDLQISRG